MAICSSCKQEMSDPKVKTCTHNSSIKFPGGAEVNRIPFYPRNLTGEQLKILAEMNPDYVLSPSSGERCHECNVAVGGLHHLGCDDERCPACGGQLVSCRCFDGA